MSNGILLKRLIATGLDVPVAEVPFERGANVITGASNTGKSYILHCIDYLFGAKEIKRIGEAKRYSTLFLELETGAKTYTIERSLEGGRILLHPTGFDERTEDSGVEVSSKRSDTEESVSAFLLRSAGFAESAKLRKNARNTTVPLSFRQLVQFFVVPEDRIISETSPVLASTQEETRQHSAFEFLLTGRDNGELEELPDPKLRKAALTAQLDMVREMMKAESERIERDGTTRELVTPRLDEIEELLRISSAASAETSTRIRTLQQRRRDLWNENKTVESRVIVLGQLQKRFELLREAYESDLRRLEFVSEADDLFQQLQTVACPLCGSNLAEHELVAACSRSGEDSVSSIRAACEAERAKIQVLLTDLGSTLAQLGEEAAERSSEAAALRRQIEEIDRELNTALAPAAALEERRTAELLDRRRDLDALSASFDRVDELKALEAKLEKSLREPHARRDPSPDIGIDLHAFAKQIEALLREWHWLSKDARVAFDRAAWDVTVDGEPRKSNGKGVRALVHAAFALGLLRHCRSKSLPHAGFVVLDSPLTAYKERKGTASTEEVHDAFFRSVATTFKNDQVIILENKEPSDEVKKSLHFVDFAGDARFGRAGFFASLAADDSESAPEGE